MLDAVVEQVCVQSLNFGWSLDEHCSLNRSGQFVRASSKNDELNFTYWSNAASPRNSAGSSGSRMANATHLNLDQSFSNLERLSLTFGANLQFSCERVVSNAIWIDRPSIFGQSFSVLSSQWEHWRDFRSNQEGPDHLAIIPQLFRNRIEFSATFDRSVFESF